MELCALCQNAELAVAMLTVKLLCLTVGQILVRRPKKKKKALFSNLTLVAVIKQKRLLSFIYLFLPPGDSPGSR